MPVDGQVSLEALPLVVVVAALLACGAPNNAQPARHAPGTTPQVQAGPRSCYNDYGCGPGEQCAKDSYAIEGICAKTVNAYGVPVYTPPRASSVGPGTGSCQFVTDCSPGFQCVKTSGGLYGNCMK